MLLLLLKQTSFIHFLYPLDPELKATVVAGASNSCHREKKKMSLSCLNLDIL